MTREEAISIMNVIVHMLEPQYDTDRIEDAVEMAIKALEQEPREDAISRQAVLDGIDTYINKAQSTGTQDDFYSFAELVVKELPSVTPQEPFMNKPCIANHVCHEDKVKVLDQIRNEIVELPTISINANDVYKAQVLQIIDKYKADREVKE